mgnify:CR=1 FL=1|jgi:hypothetical protein
MPADLNKYGNTYDITAKKWVKDMTDSELETYGYKEEEEDGEEGQALQTVATKTRAKKTVA